MPIKIYLKTIIVIGLVFLFFYPLIQKYNLINNRIYQTCQFVKSHIIPVKTNLNEWLMNCRVQSRSYGFRSDNIKIQLEKGNQILSELKVSHLELFDQQESQAIWEDTDLENGIESKFIDGELIITRIHPNSEAFGKGLLKGDRVVLGKDDSLSPYELNKWKGNLEIERRKVVKSIELRPKTLNIQRDVSLTEVNGFKVISLESFKSQYFSSEKLNSIFSKVKATDKVVIDLRGNNGGNFVAGLRFLSAFFCKPTLVGYMKKEHAVGRTGYFEDNLNDEYQIEVLNRYNSIGLKTFESKLCLPKPKLVLIDANSKSTAEWVALAFSELQSIPVRGAASAGELLVGIWYDISSIWGTVVKLSIPEAYYESIQGKQIEGHGVSVESNIYPRRADYEQGRDSEVWQAVQNQN